MSVSAELAASACRPSTNYSQPRWVHVITTTQCTTLARRCWAAALTIAFVGSTPIQACPFCTALGPTLAMRRAESVVVAVGEVERSEGQALSVRMRQVLEGARALDGRQTVGLTNPALKAGGLVLLFGNRADEKTGGDAWRFDAVAVDELALAYFVRSPSLRLPPAERLPYFVRFLEHPNVLVAEDAYLEFGHASYDDVRRVADRLPMEKLRAWLTDGRVPPARKGFYGLALGLAAQDADRRQNTALLEQLLLEPADDFRAGFDGVLGGYLILRGEAGLARIEGRYLANPDAADGDVRHALTALRFYREFGREISSARLAQAVAHLLARPEFAGTAITDLARLQDWSRIEQIAGMYGTASQPSLALNRAVVGYLTICPQEAAAESLRLLRQRDPQGVAIAESALSQTGSLRQ